MGSDFAFFFLRPMNGILQLKARIDELERKLKEVDVSAQSSIEAREGDEHR